MARPSTTVTCQAGHLQLPSVSDRCRAGCALSSATKIRYQDGSAWKSGYYTNDCSGVVPINAEGTCTIECLHSETSTAVCQSNGYFVIGTRCKETCSPLVLERLTQLDKSGVALGLYPSDLSDCQSANDESRCESPCTANAASSVENAVFYCDNNVFTVVTKCEAKCPALTTERIQQLDARSTAVIQKLYDIPVLPNCDDVANGTDCSLSCSSVASKSVASVTFHCDGTNLAFSGSNKCRAQCPALTTARLQQLDTRSGALKLYNTSS
eukprot:219421_1